MGRPPEFGTYLKPVEDRHRCSRRGRDGPLETLRLQRVTDAAIADSPFIAALLAGSRSDGACVEDMSATQKPLHRNGFRARAQDNGTSGAPHNSRRKMSPDPFLIGPQARRLRY